MKQKQQIAFLLVHRYNRLGFLQLIASCDALLHKHHGHLFIYDMAPVDRERLTRQDVQQFSTPIRLITGTDQSIISAYNRLLDCVPRHFLGVCLLQGVIISPGWLKMNLVKRYIDNNLVYLFLQGQYFVMYIPMDVCQRVGSFEERFFIGPMYLFDYAWRCRAIGGTVLRSRRIPGVLVQKLFPKQNTTLTTYYDEKNRWLFARLRLAGWQAVTYLIGSWLWHGVWKHGIFCRAYWRAWWDGLRLGRLPVKPIPNSTS